MALRPDDSDSEDQLAFSSAESDASTGVDAAPARQRSKPSKIVRQKDDEELELERLVFGNKAGFRQNLFKDDGVLELDAAQGKELELAAAASDDDNDHENLDDADLFMWDTAVKAPVAGDQVIISGKVAKATEYGPQPAWEDSDDENLTVSLATVSRLRRLRQFEGEDVITGTEYARRLRNEHLRMNPLPGWVRDAEQRPAKRRRRSSIESDQSLDSLDSDAGSDLEAEPLEEFLRDVRLLASQGSKAKKRPLRPEIIDIQQTRRIPDTHTAAVSSLSFHPQYPVLLSASPSSIIYLHRIAPTAHPTPNPALTSVLAKGVDVRRAEFLGQGGERVLFAGRRPYYHRWDLGTGAVERVSQVTGHQRDHRSMERFRASPCGRYVAIAGTGKKGGGSVNIVDAETTLWVAEARLDARHGVADFAWWADGEGLTVLGRDGHVGEYSLARRRFIGVWRDEGSFDTAVVALGGRGGPGSLGGHRYVAVGSGSGIVNLYDRGEMLLPSTGAKAGDDGDEMVGIKERPVPAKRFEQLVTGISHLAFSPDGQLLLFASKAKPDSLRLVHVSSRTVYRNWPTGKTPIGRVSAVAFGRQSDMLAVGNDKGTIRLWEIRC